MQPTTASQKTRAAERPTRPVRLLAAGGTISMQGERAVPSLDAAQLVAAIPELKDVQIIAAESVLGLPGPQITLPQAHDLIRRATEAASRGEGVVITTGTDTLEELAMLCALTHDADAPIAITGANRPASAPGADGPANLLDAFTVAASHEADKLGTVVVFGGEIHAATTVRKVDATGPAAFASPTAGPIGRALEGRLWLHARPRRPSLIVPETLEHRVPIVTAALGDDGDTLARVAEHADGVVVVAFGAGHLTPGMARALATVAATKPVALTCATQRGGMLRHTYGFEGAEGDLRATGAVCVPFLSPVAARIALLCCLGARLGRAQIADKLAQWDT